MAGSKSIPPGNTEPDPLRGHREPDSISHAYFETQQKAVLEKIEKAMDGLDDELQPLPVRPAIEPAPDHSAAGATHKHVVESSASIRWIWGLLIFICLGTAIFLVNTRYTPRPSTFSVSSPSGSGTAFPERTSTTHTANPVIHDIPDTDNTASPPTTVRAPIVANPSPTSKPKPKPKRYSEDI